MPGVSTAVDPEPEQLSFFEVGPDVPRLCAGAALFVLSRQAENTRRSYALDWKQFTQWCTAAGRRPLPASPDTMRLFLVAELDRGRAISTVGRRAAAIVDRHRENKLPSPFTDEVRDVLRGARRARGVAPARKPR